MVTRLVAGRVYDYSHNMGRGAVSGIGFNSAIGLAYGEGDVVYLLNRGWEFVPGVPWNRTGRGARVGVYTMGSEPGDEEFVGEFSKYGSGDGELIWPVAIATDSESRVYVSDEWLNRVNVFDKDGKFLSHWGATGQGEGHFNGPSGIAFDAQEDLYVVDSRNHRIQKYTKDGGFLLQWGGQGNGEGEFDSPWGITVDRDGYVYVADHKNHRAQKFTGDGQFVAEFGSHGEGRGELKLPSDVAVDPDGDVYVCDWANNRVQLYDPQGKFLTSFMGDATELSKWGKMVVATNPDALKRRREVKDFEVEWRLAMPTAVVFDERYSRLVIADTQRNRLQVYNKLKNYTEPARNL